MSTIAPNQRTAGTGSVAAMITNTEPNEYDDDEDDENKQETILLDTTDEELEDDDDDDGEDDIDYGVHSKSDKSIRGTQSDLYDMSDRKRLHIPPISEQATAMATGTGRARYDQFPRDNMRLPSMPSLREQQQRLYTTTEYESNNNEAGGGITITAGDDDHESTHNGNANDTGSESEHSTKLLLLPNRRPQSSAGRFSSNLMHSGVGGEESRRLSGLFGMTSKRMRTDPSGTGGLNFNTHLQTQKSLFSDKNLSNSTTSLNSLMQRRSFNPSLYGSTSALSDSRLLNTNSPFYNGRTMFGGASAYSRRATSTQRTLRVPTQIRPASSLSTLCSSTNSLVSPVDGTNAATSALSNTAKRILDIINQSTTPLADVKKMATANTTATGSPIRMPALVQNRKRFDEADMIQHRSIRLSTPRTPYSRVDVSTRNSSAMTNELQVPSMSQLLQMKKKLQNNTERVRQLATGSRSVLNQAQDYKLPDTLTQTAAVTSSSASANATAAAATKVGGKVVNKMNKTRESTNKKLAEQNETVAQVNLPNIQLPAMRALPDLGSVVRKQDVVLDTKPKETVISKTIKSSQPMVNESKANKQKSSASNVPKPTSAMSNAFKFSSPIELKASSATKISETVNNFKFSYPVAASTLMTVAKQFPANSSASMANFKFSASTALLHSTSAQSPLTAKVAVSTPPPLKNASCLDALKSITPKASGNTAATSAPMLSDLFKSANAGKWECIMCLIQNEQTKEKCVACESPKPGGIASKAKTIDTAKVPPIKSKVAPLTTDVGFKNIVAAQTANWECTACLTRNEPSRRKCNCCDQSRASASAELAPSFSFGSGGTSSSATTSPKFQFGIQSKVSPITTDVGFKNIVAAQNANWECTACMTRNDPSRQKCNCCDQTRPGASAAESASSSFSFGASSSGSSSAATPPKFQFGIPPGMQTTPPKAAIGSSIVSQDKPSATPTSFVLEKPAVSSGGFTFGKPAEVTGKPVTEAKFSFGIQPLPSESNSTTPKDTTDSKPVFKLGASPAFGSTTFGSMNANSTSTNLLFGVVSTSSTTNVSSVTNEVKPVFSFGAAAKQQPTLSSTVATTTITTPAFSFGSKSTTVSHSSIVPSTIQSMPTLAFGSPKSVTTATNVKESQGGFSFSSATVVSNVKTSTGVTAAASMPIFGAQGTASAITFGSPALANKPAAATTAPTAAGAQTFVFGAPVAAPSIGQSSPFGGSSSTNDKSVVQSAGFFATPSTLQSKTSIVAPTQVGGLFGNSNASTPSNAFTGTATDLVTPNQQPSTVSQFMFGSGTSSSTSTPNIGFGLQQATPTFGQQTSNQLTSFSSFGTPSANNLGGVTATPTFGNISNAFGSSAATATVMPTFGTQTAFGAPAAVATPTVGTSNTSLFGGTSNTQMNAFGGPAVGVVAANVFGGSSSASASPFGTPSHTPPPNSDEPSSKKLATGFNTVSSSNSVVSFCSACTFSNDNNTFCIV